MKVDDLAAYRLWTSPYCEFGAGVALDTSLFIDAEVCAGAGAACFPTGGKYEEWVLFRILNLVPRSTKGVNDYKEKELVLVMC